ncbi:MAG TPA: hypothetical protein VGE74_14690, partial [Gemmata sp.]
LDYGVLRARRLLTRRIVTHRVADTAAVKPLDSTSVGPPENALADRMMGTSNRGYELRFRDGSQGESYFDSTALSFSALMRHQAGAAESDSGKHPTQALGLRLEYGK